jgi:hypothetical protein
MAQAKSQIYRLELRCVMQYKVSAETQHLQSKPEAMHAPCNAWMNTLRCTRALGKFCVAREMLAFMQLSDCTHVRGAYVWL